MSRGNKMLMVRAWWFLEECFAVVVIVTFGLILIALDDPENDDL